MKTIIPSSFFFDTPLYTPIIITKENEKDALKLISGDFTFDEYNPTLKQETTYVVSGERFTSSYLSNCVGYRTLQLKCVRNGFQIMVFILLEKNYEETQGYILTKVGQSPSIADLHISKIRQYDKVLDKSRIKEITKAVGLAANGVGIGSFVYLRRVFEFLLEEAHSIAIKDSNWDDEIYKKSRIVERIELLSHYLPDFLVSNKSMYGILSVGIHSLEEEECLKYFDALKVGIELIIEEKIEQQQKIKMIEEAKKRLNLITTDVARNNDKK